MYYREAAQKWAQSCIDAWVGEDRYELNDVLGTNFTDEEVDQIIALAYKAKAILPAPED